MLNAQKTHQFSYCPVQQHYILQMCDLVTVWCHKVTELKAGQLMRYSRSSVFMGERSFCWCGLWHLTYSSLAVFSALSTNKPPLLQWTVEPQSKWHLMTCAPFPFSSSSLLTSTWDYSPSRHMWGQHNPVASVESTLSLPTESTSVESDPSLSVPCPSFNLLPSGLL